MELKLAVVPLCPSSEGGSSNDHHHHHHDRNAVFCAASGSSASWEPGFNRSVDLPAIIARGSPTGLAEVHLTCGWGAGPATAVSPREQQCCCGLSEGNEGEWVA